jgi:O-antigen/teichoic acid export membrane protein
LISKQFIKSSFIFSVIGALPLASSIILLPFYTNMLTTDQFGVLALYITLTVIMQVLVNFSLEQYVGIHWIDFQKNVQKAKENVGTVVSLLFIIGIVFLVIFIISGKSLFSSFSAFTRNKTSLEFYPWGFMSLLTAIFNSLFKSYTTLLIYQQRSIRFFWLNIFNFVLTIGLSLSILFYHPFSLAGPMYGRLLSGLGIFLMALFFFVKEFGISFHKKLLKGIAVFCFPLLVYSILSWIAGNVDRYIIAYFLKASDVGVFVFAIQCTLLLDFFQSGLSSSIYPKVYNIWKEKNINYGTIEVNRYFNGFTAITLLIIPALVITLPLAIPVVVKNKDFYLTFNFLAILFAGYALSGLRAYFWAPLLYFKRTKALPKIFLFSAVFQIFAGIGLIYYFGLIGAVWANFLVKPIQIIFIYLESRKVFDYKFNRWKLVYLPMMFIAVVLLSESLATNKTRLFLEAGQFVIAVSMVFLVYRKEVIPVIRQRFNV